MKNPERLLGDDIHLLTEELKRDMQGEIDSRYWPLYNSGIDSYQKTFEEVLCEKEIPDLLKRFERPIIIDLMASTSAIRDLCSQGRIIPEIGIAVGINDARTEREKLRDSNINIVHIEGNLLNFETWRKIGRKLDGRKASLILERASGGLSYIPINKRFYNLALNELWQILDDNGGTLLAETHTFFKLENRGIFLDQWAEEAIQQGVDVVYGSKAIKLTKFSNSPSTLPLIY
jgi:hypothetical protein